MSRRAWIAVAFVVAAAAGVAARLWVWPPAPSQETAPEAEETPAAVAVTETLVLEPADLYFPSLAGGLQVHRQSLPAGTPEERARHLVRALIDGPGGVVDGDLYSPLPEGTSLERVYFLRAGTVALDLRSKESQRAESEAEAPDDETEEDAPELVPVVQAEVAELDMGSQEELAAVYSLVNTVTLNQIEGAERVILLWDGRQPRTFAGHVDVSRPLTPDTSRVRTP